MAAVAVVQGVSEDLDEHLQAAAAAAAAAEKKKKVRSALIEFSDEKQNNRTFAMRGPGQSSRTLEKKTNRGCVFFLGGGSHDMLLLYLNLADKVFDELKVDQVVQRLQENGSLCLSAFPTFVPSLSW